MPYSWDELQEPATLGARWRATLRKQPSAFLLAVQLLVVLLLPFLEGSSAGRTGITLLSLSALVIAVFTVRSTPALTFVSVTLALPASGLLLWSLVGSQPPAAAVLTNVALAVFYAYTAYALIAYMFADAWVTPDELFAVGACFTVLVFSFAYVYLAVQGVWPASFTAFDGPGERTLLELLYFSAANLTSVGLADVLPIRAEARAVVSLEQLTGVLYVAMVISRLVALTVMRARH